jgi:hypothetical protein
MRLEIPLFQGLSLKIGDPSSSIKDYPTAHLQKGFLLLDRGQELAEEAVGFGVPVLKSGLQTIFPESVTLTWLQKGSTWEITALFKLNLVEKISIGANKHVENRLLYAIKKNLEAIIRRFPVFRGMLTATSSKLRQVFGLEISYVEADLSSDVNAIYIVDGQKGIVSVEIDASNLPAAITEVVVMNEQGAHYFDRYQDTSGIALQGDEIGCWDVVTADEAWFKSRTRQVGFRLGQVKDARLFRGRELVDSRLAWAGFGYSFPPSIKRLQYVMRIERLA